MIDIRGASIKQVMTLALEQRALLKGPSERWGSQWTWQWPDCLEQPEVVPIVNTQYSILQENQLVSNSKESNIRSGPILKNTRMDIVTALFLNSTTEFNSHYTNITSIPHTILNSGTFP
jgi:hypothetical protein